MNLPISKTAQNMTVSDLAFVRDLYRTMSPSKERDTAIADIESAMIAKIDGIELPDELFALAAELEEKGVIDFGYPKKTITPSPIVRFFQKIFGLQE